jgi:hypothetical protein
MNPKVKKGDKIIIINAGQSGIPQINGLTVTVTSVGSNGDIRFITSSGQAYSLYGNTSDSYSLSDRKSQISYLKEDIKKAEKELTEKRTSLLYLEKYETEEDAVADKLEKILTAHAENKSSEKRANAIAKVLKELKNSNLL